MYHGTRNLPWDFNPVVQSVVKNLMKQSKEDICRCRFLYYKSELNKIQDALFHHLFLVDHSSNVWIHEERKEKEDKDSSPMKQIHI